MLALVIMDLPNSYTDGSMSPENMVSSSIDEGTFRTRSR